MAITPKNTSTGSQADIALAQNGRSYLSLVQNGSDTNVKLAPRSDWSEMRNAEHFVQFYEADTFLLDSLSGFIGAGLGAGDACIVVATEVHRQGLEERLKDNGLDLAAVRARGKYISLDASETLSKFMVNGSPDPQRFTEVIGELVTRAAKSGSHVRIFGEMVALLWMEGNAAAAIRLEELWNELQNNLPPFSLFCAYAMHGFDGEAYGAQFTEICGQHARVIPDESYTALASPDERLLAISLLQQKANSLEAEIAERKAVEERLRALEKRKDEFISMASHELKTPVTSLKGFTQVLHRRFKKRDDEESLRFLSIMDTQLNKLTRLINDLLDISKMQQGRLDYREDPFDLNALVQEVVENLQAGISTHQLLIVDRTEAQVVGDRDRVGQVLMNLLANAIKYSPKADTVIVRVSKDQQNAIVSVQDFGIGIDPAHHELIFGQFYQVTDAEEKTYPGLGVGLYISAEIIRRHAGRIWVESRKYHGSTFAFSLPLQEVKAPKESYCH